MPGFIDIPREVKEKTGRCGTRFFCLSSPQEIVCPPEYLLNENTLFVVKKKERFCEYFLPYGGSGFCCCPVRKELYSRHQI